MAAHFHQCADNHLQSLTNRHCDGEEIANGCLRIDENARPSPKKDLEGHQGIFAGLSGVLIKSSPFLGEDGVLTIIVFVSGGCSAGRFAPGAVLNPTSSAGAPVLMRSNLMLR